MTARSPPSAANAPFDQLTVLREQRGPPRLRSGELLALARACGADDAGLVSIDDPALSDEVPFIATAFPTARTLLALVGRMHREPVRSPARSIANLEFHASGRGLDDIARGIVRRLEDADIPALNPAMAFPMEMDDFPQRAWIVSHKRVAEAAGLGRMGLHRSLIHPRFGSFILLNTVLIAAEVDEVAVPLEHNPCLSCKLCVAACPVGALKPDGGFDFSACLNHNYQQFMGGFVNFVEDVADSRSAADFRARHSYAETVTRWQSLSYGPNYNAAYCIAVCPAGEDVIGPYLADKAEHLRAVVDPLKKRTEPVYVVRGSDAADHVARRFPHKRVRFVRQSVRATTVGGFLTGMPLTFQPGRARGLSAVYHFLFTGRETARATVTIRDQRITIVDGHVGTHDLRIIVDGSTWVKFLNREVGLLRLLATRRLRLRGSPRLLAAFGRCFPI
ncbi:SCP2 sterol-binding domain-containing protein [Methylobacterium durans]|uniref:SCP2 sterol-binding domain-containing protein n=1 Tax=Methylobacterium durans TaxID=2202825 RepID=UPI002B002B19|nr:SCP2 sterol-binding domain-containing protein [Methylobacterium durans]MEA1834289.1 SCP2 sterol-binding domain-containing protein [Methylobacterium durans]